jgi:hypothetical protein
LHWEAALVAVIAAAVYRPWAAPALPLTDFGVFMPRMDPGDSLWAQYLSVAGYHVSEGRLALVQYVYMVFAKNAFGFDPAGWHWMYFVVNCLVIILARRLMLATGASRPAAFGAITLWALMPPVAEGWIRPTGEPFALVFFLAACLLLVNYAEKRDWRRRALLAALCCVGVMLSKEILVLLLPVAWIVSRLRFDRDGATWTPWQRRDTLLLAVAGSAVAVTVAAVVAVVLSAPEGYAAKYGVTYQTSSALLKRLEMILVPTTPRLGSLARLRSDPAWILLIVLPSLLWVRLVASGLYAGRSRALWPLVIGFVWVAPGFLAYIPWTSSGEFYFTPFALGAMFAAAHLVDRALSHSPGEKRLAFATIAFLTCVAAVEAKGTVNKFEIRAMLNDAVVKDLRRSGGTRMLVGAVPKPVPDERWWWARNLEGFFVAATKVPVSASRDLACDEATAMLRDVPDVVVVSREGACGRISPASVAYTARLPRLEWPYLWATRTLYDRVYVTRPEARMSSAVRAVEAPL